MQARPGMRSRGQCRWLAKQARPATRKTSAVKTSCYVIIIIIIKLPDQAIASTPSAPRPPGAEETSCYVTFCCLIFLLYLCQVELHPVHTFTAVAADAMQLTASLKQTRLHLTNSMITNNTHRSTTVRTAKALLVIAHVVTPTTHMLPCPACYPGLCVPQCTLARHLPHITTHVTARTACHMLQRLQLCMACCMPCVLNM
jgi:hypothetical protein